MNSASVVSVKSVVDPRNAERSAGEFSVARYGRGLPTMSRARAIEYMRLGWGLKMGKARVAAFDAAIESGEVKAAGRKTFSVNYNMPLGHSAGGSSIGSRPISYNVLDTATIDAWARFEVMSGGV